LPPATNPPPAPSPLSCWPAQLPTGELPRNSLVNGKIAPDTGGDQLDETAYPILMPS